MVHGLQTLAYLNRQAVLESGRRQHGGPVTADSVNRRLQNTPWTPAEYGGPTAQETYAAGNRVFARKTRAFAGKTPMNSLPLDFASKPRPGAVPNDFTPL